MRRIRFAAGCLALSALLIACEAAGAGVSDASLDADVRITSGGLKFDTQLLRVPAGRPFTILYLNESPMPHNVAIYRDESAGEPVFAGDVIEFGGILYEVPALPAGDYVFRCDLHPHMTGLLIAD